MDNITKNSNIAKADYETQSRFFRVYNTEAHRALSEYFFACVEWAKMGEENVATFQEFAAGLPECPILSLMQQNSETFGTTILVNDNVGKSLAYLAKSFVNGEKAGTIVDTEKVNKLISHMINANAEFAFAINENEIIDGLMRGGYAELVNNLDALKNTVELYEDGETVARTENGKLDHTISQEFVVKSDIGKIMLPCYEQVNKELYEKIKSGENVEIDEYGKNSDGSFSVVNQDAAVNNPRAASCAIAALRLVAEVEKSGVIDADTISAYIRDITQKNVLIVEAGMAANKMGSKNIAASIINEMTDAYVKGIPEEEIAKKTEWRMQNEFTLSLNEYGNEEEYLRYAKEHNITSSLVFTVPSNEAATSLNLNPYKEGVAEQPKTLNRDEATNEKPTVKTAEKSDKNKGSER